MGFRALKRHLAGRLWSQPIWENLHRIALYGMNFGPSTVTGSGELWLLRKLSHVMPHWNPVVIVDVGANVGEYAEAALAIFGHRARLYCIEPSSAAFEQPSLPR